MNSPRMSDLIRRAAYLVVFLALLIGFGKSLHAFYRIFITPDPADFARPWFWIQVAWSVPLTLLAASSLLFRKPSRANTAILLFSLLVAMYPFEIALWALNMDTSFSREGRQMHFEHLRKQGITVDMRTPLNVIFDLRRAGVQAVPTFSPSVQTVPSGPLFPLSAISRKLTVLCNHSGSYATYISDEHGFNNPTGLWRHRLPFDIAIFGDSFAQGFCVDQDKDFSSYVRHKFPATANLGMSGTGPLAQLATMREYLPFLKPRLVLWLYYEGNDLDDLDRELRDPMLQNYLMPGFTQGLIRRQGEIDLVYLEQIERKLKDFRSTPPPTPPQTDSEITKTMRLFRTRGLIFSALRARVFSRDPVHDKSLLDSYGQVVLAADRQVDALGGKLVLVYLPDWVRIKGRLADLGYQQKEDVLAIAKRAGIPVVDIGEIFRTHPDAAHGFLVYAGSHYSEEGYRLAADYVLSRLPEFTQSGSRLSR